MKSERKPGRTSTNQGKRRFRNKDKRYNQAITPRFEGRQDELKGLIFDCSDAKQADNYSKTIKEVTQYVGTNYKYSRHIRYLVENLELLIIEIPSDPVSTVTLSETQIWKLGLSEYMKRKITLRENVKSLYSLIWGQYSKYI